MSSDLDIMLLGKTGAGKSKTGNTLLDRKNVFRTVADTSSATIQSQREVTKLDDGRVLCVVDTPGVGDTRGDKQYGEKIFMDAITNAIMSNPDGYHALLIVIKFGQRFTQEDADTMEYLKQVFGSNFIQKYCVVVMSCGDQFKYEQEEGLITTDFTDWCKTQTGVFRTIFEDVKERVLLWNNRGNKEENDKQRSELIAMIDKLVLGGRRYTDDKFRKAKAEYEKRIRDEKISQIGKRVQDEISLILQDLNRGKMETDIDVQLFAMRDLLNRANELMETVDQEKKQTKDLLNIKTIISRTQNQVETEIKTLEMKKEMEEKKKDEAADRAKEVRELKQLIETQQNELQQTRQKLNDDYIKTRDSNNDSWCTIC